MNKMDAQQFAELCSDFVNSFSNKDKEFAQAMARRHRTLQQSFTRMIIEYFRVQAQESDDLRNRASIELSKKIIKMIDDEKITLPFI